MEHKCKKVDLKPIEKCALDRDKIIKALECCTDKKYHCEDCPYFYKSEGIKSSMEILMTDALSLINELTVENERLRGELDRTEKALITLDKAHNALFTDTFRIEANTVRKMQERITKHATNGYPRKVRLDVIDQIAKEMLEGTK